MKSCHCCGKPTLEEKSRYDICPVCGWEDDAIQNDDPNYAGGANILSLNEAKVIYAEMGNIIPYERELKVKFRAGKRQATQEAVQQPLTAAFI
jgi:hypothetical protein